MASLFEDLTPFELQPIKLPKKARTTLLADVCDHCGYQFFARSLKAIVQAADEHTAWHDAVNEALT